MKIQKLTLRNFKSFKEIDFDFYPQLTVIVGANGIGKTSIMEGIAIAISTIFSKMDGLASQSINKNQARLEAFTVGSTQDVQPQYPVEISAEAKTESQEMAWKRSLNSSTGRTTVIDAKEMIDLGISYQKRLRAGDTDLTLPVIAY